MSSLLRRNKMERIRFRVFLAISSSSSFQQVAIAASRRVNRASLLALILPASV